MKPNSKLSTMMLKFDLFNRTSFWADHMLFRSPHRVEHIHFYLPPQRNKSQDNHRPNDTATTITIFPIDLSMKNTYGNATRKKIMHRVYKWYNTSKLCFTVFY